jgi:UDP:flavonoid glycosyltransferase YjiC (YdhE family)
LHDKAKFQHILDEELGDEQVKERFRIVDWIDVDPGEVLMHKNVVAYVHHGGANSYYEAAR